MIKITQIQTTNGETVLVFSYDNAGQTYTLNVNKSEVISRLLAVKKILGRALTITDAQLVIIQIINEARAGQSSLLETFDLAPYIGVNLEP